VPRLVALWAAKVFWAVGPFLPWVTTAWGVICGLRACLFVYYFFGKRVFYLVVREPLWLSPTVSDQDKTTFITLHGIYCYTAMTLSLKNAGATYQKAI
jgi:hypothetical protein